MATFNKPGVYVQESLSPSAQLPTSPSQSQVVFIGVTDRGPTTKLSNNNIVGVPTLITSWTDFVNTFGYGTDMFASTMSTTSADMRYAIYNFFANNGGQAYILRTPNSNAVNGSLTIYGKGNTISTTITATVGSDAAGNISVQVPAASGDTSIFKVGAAVTLSGLSGSTVTPIAGTWALKTATNSSTFVLAGTTAAVSSVSTSVTITATAPAANTSAALILTAKDAGEWSKNLWARTVENTNGTFDLYLYVKPGSSAENSSQVTDAYRVERFLGLSLNSNSTLFAPNNITSAWVTASVSNPTVGSTVPFTTYYADATSGALTKSGQWQVGKGSLAYAEWGSSTAGSDGSTAPTAANTNAQLDNLPGNLILNQPNATDNSTVNALVTYAATRGDSFVIIDPVKTTTVDSAISGANYTQSAYGAVYYPHLIIKDPASKTGGTYAVPPGSAVAAVYQQTDAAVGPYQSPAGVGVKLNAIDVYKALSSADFDAVNTGSPYLNIIRNVPGAGLCVMGARTLSSARSDMYISIRRTLNYLSTNLSSAIQFAVFEPNTPRTWSRINSVLENYLDSFWRSGGLNGATKQQAYYIVCDSTNNSPASIAAGELNVSVGLALQYPAEFVVLTLRQSQGSTTITTTV